MHAHGTLSCSCSSGGSGSGGNSFCHLRLQAPCIIIIIYLLLTATSIVTQLSAHARETIQRACVSIVCTSSKIMFLLIVMHYSDCYTAQLPNIIYADSYRNFSRLCIVSYHNPLSYCATTVLPFRLKWNVKIRNDFASQKLRLLSSKQAVKKWRTIPTTCILIMVLRLYSTA